jgi:hypothetical protein
LRCFRIIQIKRGGTALDDHTAHDALAQGFSAALMIPAAASTLKQAQREAAGELHVLADYYRRAQRGGASCVLDGKTRQAACRFGRIIVEQSINGTAFFLAVKLSVMTAGTFGGMLAQLGITGNTIITPHQTQKFNPAKSLFAFVGSEPDWVAGLPEPLLQRFAHASGRFADWCGYSGTAVCPVPPSGAVASSLRLEFRPRPPAGQRPLS